MEMIDWDAIPQSAIDQIARAVLRDMETKQSDTLESDKKATQGVKKR